MKSSHELVMNKFNTGIVFDIKKFAVHDGLGIRNTIFLKGCNLRCVWCHNPEGLESIQKPIIKEKCISCNRCLSVEKDNLVSLTNGTRKIKQSNIERLEKYFNNCPVEAIGYDSTVYTVDQLVVDMVSDKVFLKYGGVTFSGGEPLLQYDFLLACIKKLKEENIHIAIETALAIETKKLKALLPYVDEWFFDIKLFDDANHIKYTGISNKIILENATVLLQSNCQLTVRTPMIPKISDSTKNIQDIGNFIYKIDKDAKWELLNFNPLAIGKYKSLNMDYYYKENPRMYTNQEMEEFKNIARKCGLKNIK